jgi:hypothetical protein
MEALKTTANELASNNPAIKELVDSKFKLMDGHLLQSPYLNLQAAGSQGLDSSEGIHLRWFLNGYLGENHLPKGNLAGNNNFYNRKNDFVRVFRIPYDERNKVSRDFSLEFKPSAVNNGPRVWVYKLEQGIFHLRFLDSQQYQTALQDVDPLVDHRAFLEKYGDSLFELELKSLLSFSVTVDAKQVIQCRLETFSVQNKSLSQDIRVLSARKSSEADSIRVVAENIKYIQFDSKNAIGLIFRFETYFDVLRHASKTIAFVGNFALTTDTVEALSQLEDSSRFKVNDLWRKFNDNAHVNVKNYQDRWGTGDGLREGVTKYISLSDTDPAAIEVYSAADSSDETAMDISLLQFLNVASTDFHIARMLELGYVDTSKPVAEASQFIYFAEYITEKDPENYTVDKFHQHLYMSLPTGRKEQRLPQTLTLLPVTYGLTVDNGTSTPLAITDEDGYIPFERLRYVKLKAKLKYEYQKRLSFFNPSLEFQSSDFSTPVFVGIENRKDTQTDWIRPELSHDTVYNDTSGVKETLGIFFNKTDKPDFFHEITEEGVDVYAAYPINIFSRASSLSNEQQTDNTIFRRANTLRPPVNVAAQLIQNEDPLLLTAAVEQTWLRNIDSSKTEILCRLTFDYNHINDVNYRYGNKVQIFHKKAMPLNIAGGISAVDNTDASNPFCILTTQLFTYASNGVVLTPRVNPATRHTFIGSTLSYNSINYKVVDIILTAGDGSLPKIKIRKNERRIAIPTTGSNYSLTQVFDGPIPNPQVAFLVVENLSKAENWVEDTNNKLSFDINLGLPSWPENTESYQDAEGNPKVEIVKGIWDTATITPVTGRPGFYTIGFDLHILNNHSQFVSPDNTSNTPSVNWYRGFIRIHKSGDASSQFERKLLKVDQILELNSGNTLSLIAFDPNYSTTNSSENIKTGNGIRVNYHPGYRVYLRKYDPAKFNKTAILPIDNEGTRSTILGLRTLDTTTLDINGNPYVSPMSVPAALMARELRPPQKPQVPIGPLFANPPDFFNKAQYSFITQFNHSPWGLVFFRIDINKILSLLYKPQTIEAIKQQLPPMKDDAFVGNRWQNLLSFDYSSNAGDFQSFPVGTSGTVYKFPKPDRADIFTTPFNKPGDVVHLIKGVINSNLLPLTEQPLIFQHIKGDGYMPLPKKQKVTDSAGKVLHPTHADFDQAPMAKKINSQKVLFIDFTLDGNMSSETAYFYTVRELSNSMQMGEPSPFLGPVRTLNTKAPEALNIRKMSVETATIQNEGRNAIWFEIHPIAPSQEVSKIQIYRALDAADALTPTTMTIVKEIPLPIAPTEEGQFEIADTFATDVEIPFGIPLYYKLVAVRTITYQDVNNNTKTIDVYAEPTKTFVTNIIDTSNPKAPTLEVTQQTVTAGVIEQITFRWNKTCRAGKYTLQMLTTTGAWKKLHTVTTNNGADLVFIFIGNLKAQNEAGEPIHYQFKVDVENTSGLINREAKVFTFSV